jgi:hypothetical protein
MQRLILVSIGILAAFLFLASTSLAEDDDDDDKATEVFKSQVVCDLDGVAPFNDLVSGVATIFDNGDLKLKGLRKNTLYTCLFICNVGAKVFAADCSTNSKGKLEVLLEGLGPSADLGDSCGQPIVTLFTDDPDDDGDFCNTGYGQP